jgi:hypothetical protein
VDQLHQLEFEELAAQIIFGTWRLSRSINVHPLELKRVLFAKTLQSALLESRASVVLTVSVTVNLKLSA